MYSGGVRPQIAAASSSDPRPRVPVPSLPAAGFPAAPLIPRGRARQRGVDPVEVMRIAAAFDKRPRRARRLGLAQQNAVRPPPQDLPELPRIEPHMVLVDAVDRRLDDDGRAAVPRPCRPGIDEPGHVSEQPRHIERAVLHPDIDVVGPGTMILAPLRMRQHMPGMVADVVDCLVRRQKLDRAVDAGCHRVAFLHYRRRPTVR